MAARPPPGPPSLVQAPAVFLLLLLCAIICFIPFPRFYAMPSEDVMSAVAKMPDCIKDLRRNDGEAPWISVYGDSLSRGMLFDTLEALNESSSPVREHLHPGHGANYSEGCTIWENRPPLERRKCGGFAFDWVKDSGREPRVRAVHTGTNRDNDMSPPVKSALNARLSFRLKTFAWEPQFDEPWLQALRNSRRLPDAILFSFGIWDMQYPPENSYSKGLVAFSANLRRFLGELERALNENRAGAPRPRLYWLSVTAVADQRLPAWKRPRMSVALARQYNELALPILTKHGIQYIDTHSSGAAHPELSRDGVHFQGALPRQHTQLFWEPLCKRGTVQMARSMARKRRARARSSEPA